MILLGSRYSVRGLKVRVTVLFIDKMEKLEKKPIDFFNFAVRLNLYNIDNTCSHHERYI